MLWIWIDTTVGAPQHTILRNLDTLRATVCPKITITMSRSIQFIAEASIHKIQMTWHKLVWLQTTKMEWRKLTLRRIPQIWKSILPLHIVRGETQSEEEHITNPEVLSMLRSLKLLRKLQWTLTKLITSRSQEISLAGEAIAEVQLLNPTTPMQLDPRADHQEGLEMLPPFKTIYSAAKSTLRLLTVTTLEPLWTTRTSSRVLLNRQQTDTEVGMGGGVLMLVDLEVQEEYQLSIVEDQKEVFRSLEVQRDSMLTREPII